MAGSLLLILAIARREIAESPVIWERHPEVWPRPIQTVLHAAQAIVEMLVFGNLGLDVVTTPLQAVMIVLALAAVWSGSRGGLRRLNPLEAAGATIVVGSYVLVYFFRANLPFSSLRPVTWYHAIPQIGAAIFAAGWWAGLSPSGSVPLTRRDVLLVSGLIVALALVQAPRAERQLIQGSPAMSEAEARYFPVPELQRLRAVYYLRENRDRQIHALGRLDSVQSLAWRLNVGRTTLRSVFGRPLVPGLTGKQDDAFDLVVLPPDDSSAAPNPDQLHAEFDVLLRPEPDIRPPLPPSGGRWPQ
jgi:hypothetical protein